MVFIVASHENPLAMGPISQQYQSYFMDKLSLKMVN